MGSSRNSPAPRPHYADPRTRLLSELNDSADNGTFTSGSSRPSSPGSTRSGPTLKPGLLNRAATTISRAEEAGVRHPWLMYMSYYVPSISWVAAYEWRFLPGDIAAGSMLRCRVRRGAGVC